VLFIEYDGVIEGSTYDRHAFRLRLPRHTPVYLVSRVSIFINMIRLTSLLTEISLASVTPYATQFVWRQSHPEDDIWECDFQAGEQDWDSASGGMHHIKMVMQRWRTPIPHFESEYQFAFMMRGRDGYGWSTAAGNSMAAGTGDLNVLALLKTVGLAILDFSEQTPDCDVIDITGADAAYEKGEQKSRIYQILFRDNGMTTGFALKEYGGKLYLIRTGIRGRTADATGVKDV
jgi:hypothetical protein